MCLRVRLFANETNAPRLRGHPLCPILAPLHLLEADVCCRSVMSATLKADFSARGFKVEMTYDHGEVMRTVTSSRLMN